MCQLCSVLAHTVMIFGTTPTGIGQHAWHVQSSIPADIIDHVHMTVCSSQKSMLQIKFLIANCVPCDYTMTIETGQPQKREHCA